MFMVGYLVLITPNFSSDPEMLYSFSNSKLILLNEEVLNPAQIIQSGLLKYLKIDSDDKTTSIYRGMYHESMFKSNTEISNYC
jgi:hypothetical protein